MSDTLFAVSTELGLGLLSLALLSYYVYLDGWKSLVGI